MKRRLFALFLLASVLSLPSYAAAAPNASMPISVLFEEPMEQGNFKSRGWYDYTTPILSSSQSVSGSSYSLEYRFPKNAVKPINGNAMRKKIPENDSVYIGYNVKYSSNWLGSQKNYHPHEFYLMTNKNGAYDGMASTNLTAYMEQHNLNPHLALQDSQNIDSSRIGDNLTQITENRGLNGCNGDSDGHGKGDCYTSGGKYRNGRSWKVKSTTIARGTWHRVEAFFKLNSIKNGKGVADGILKYWLNGTLILDAQDVMFRTAKHPDMKFNQLIIGPYIGDGSPVDQTFWIDNLVVGTESAGGDDPGDDPDNLPAPEDLEVHEIK